MYLQQLEVERYKAYKDRAVLKLFPLTILVGTNSSGKSALARAAALLAGGLSAQDDEGSPLPLQSLGLVHGVTLHDLLWGDSSHGKLELAATFAGHPSNEPVRLEVVVTAVLDTPGGDPLHRVALWKLELGSRSIELTLPTVTSDQHTVSIDGSTPTTTHVTWRGLRPTGDELELPDWANDVLSDMRAWARAVRYLVSPRRLIPSPFRVVGTGPLGLEPDGARAPLVLAANDQVRMEVNTFFHQAFGVEIDIRREGASGSVLVRQHGTSVSMAQAGQGLAQVLPVATMLVSATELGDGLDVIEHPEAELHPGAHADVADLLLMRARRVQRPILVETHSEMVLLRVRRWVAEQRISASDVGIYWVESDLTRGSGVRRIEISEDGQVHEWPEGVFYEDYEEILAIRRAARATRERGT